MARSTARKRALNTLYEADEKGQDILSLLSERLEVPGAQTPLPDYAVEMITGVAKNIRDIDSLLNEHSTGWKVGRMAVVDRNILRIAVWEMVYNDEVPDAVAIDEALGLAKTLSDEDSPAFIHGLLSAVEADSEARERALEDARAREREALAPAVAVSDESAANPTGGIDAADGTGEPDTSDKADEEASASPTADTSDDLKESGESADDTAAEAGQDDSIDFDDLVLEDPLDIPADDSRDDDEEDGDESGHDEGIES